MSTRVTSKKLAKNLILSVLAQIISLATGFILNFLVPKFIDEFQYSYWQSYVLYVSYVGVLHFGLLDGIVLRYSQYDYDELDKPKIRSQFQLLLIFTSLLTFVACVVTAFLFGNVTKIVIILVACGIITKNIFTYTSYSYQITNRISKYAILVISQKAVYAIIVIILLLFKVNNFIFYCIADLIGDVVAVLLGMIYNRGMYFGKTLPIKEVLKEGKINVSAGILLMIANLSSSLIVGGAKMITQYKWDTLTFGKISFSFSATNLFLTFVTAISVVLFPSLKRMDESELPSVYKKIRNAISPLLFLSLICYFPLCKILKMWLPKYSVSLNYLGILLPIIIFSSKVSLLTNNYLKAYRKEKIMLLINVISVGLGIGLFSLSAFAFKSLNLLLYCVVIINIVRSVASEIVVMNLTKNNFVIDFLVELIMTAGFIVCVQLFTLKTGCLIYAILMLAYFGVYYKSISELLKGFKKSKNKKEEINGEN